QWYSNRLVSGRSSVQSGQPAPQFPEMKKPASVSLGGLFVQRRCLERLDVRRLQALGAAAHFELHLLAFLERLEAAHLDRGVMREEVFATFRRGDETEALGVVEPLNGAGWHCSFLCAKCRDESGRDETG